MFKDLKIDMPAVTALAIIVLFAFALGVNVVKTGAVDPDFKQTLFALVMLAAGYYIGSSASSAKKDAPLIAAASRNDPPSPPAA